ncbi:MAG: hypothetical protein AAGF95_08900 [Chloroflexota bacterium]
MLAAVFANQGVSFADYGYFLVWTTLGNIIGGVVFVALIKYGHATQQSEEEAKESHTNNTLNPEELHQAMHHITKTPQTSRHTHTPQK